MYMFASTTVCAATFKGKIIDADTREPIEGAVVVASWDEERATPAGSTSRLKDVKETLTDKKGEWIIEGPKGRELSDATASFTFLTGTYITNPPEFIVFKPGYCSYRVGFGINACKGKMKVYNFTNSKNIGEMLELPKLTKREDRRRSLPSPIHKDGNGSFYSKQGLFIRLINEESRNLGIGEYDTLKGYEK
jgi:hypothetical protein